MLAIQVGVLAIHPGHPVKILRVVAIAYTAAESDVDRECFLKRFKSLEISEETQQDFIFSRRLGIDGIPAVFLKNKLQYDWLV